MIEINLPNIDEIKLTIQELKLSRISGGTNILGLEGKEVVFFHRQTNFLPEAEGVYFFFNYDKQLIYVGVSTNIQKRIRQHSTQTVWFTKETAYIAYVLTDEYGISPDAAEEIYIALYKPFYNGKKANFAPHGVCLIEVSETGKEVMEHLLFGG